MFGQVRKADVIEKDGFNYIKMQNLNKCAELAVTYNPNTKTPVLNLNFSKLNILANGKKRKALKTVNVNGVTFVSLRELVDAFNGTVRYDTNTKEIEVNV